MLMAGIRNRKTYGAITNKPSICANPYSNILNSMGNAHKKSPVINRKIMITIYPIIDEKKLAISFFSNASMLIF